MELSNSQLKVIKTFPFYPFGLFIQQGSRLDPFAYLRDQDNPECRQCKRAWREGAIIPLQEVCGHVKCRGCFITQSLSIDRSCPQCLSSCPECKLEWNEDGRVPVQEICGHFRCRSCVLKAEEESCACAQCASTAPAPLPPPWLDDSGEEVEELDQVEEVASGRASPEIFAGAVKEWKELGRSEKFPDIEAVEIETTVLETSALKKGPRPLINLELPSKITEADVGRLRRSFTPKTGGSGTSGTPGSRTAGSVPPEEANSPSKSSSSFTWETNPAGSDKSISKSPEILAITSGTAGETSGESTGTSKPLSKSLEVIPRRRSIRSRTPNSTKILPSNNILEIAKLPAELPPIFKAEVGLKKQIKMEKTQILETSLPEFIQMIQNGPASKAYQCQGCSSKYAIQDPSLQKCIPCFQTSENMKRPPVSISDPRYQCTVCSERFHNLARFTQHLRSHSDGLLPLVCSKCYQGFIQRSELESHPCPRKGQAILKCSSCSSIYFQQPHLPSSLSQNSPSCNCVPWATELKLFKVPEFNKSSGRVQDENLDPDPSNHSPAAEARRGSKRPRGPRSRWAKAQSIEVLSNTQTLEEGSGSSGKRRAGRKASLPKKEEDLEEKTEKKSKKRKLRNSQFKNSSKRSSIPEYITLIKSGSFVKGYQCNECSAEYDAEQVKRRSIPCSACGGIEEDDLKEQQEKKKSKFECTVCGSNFGQIAELTSHLREEHTSGRIPFICCKCCKGYMRREALDSHICAASLNIPTTKDDPVKAVIKCSACASRRRPPDPAPSSGTDLNNPQPCPCIDWARSLGEESEVETEEETESCCSSSGADPKEKLKRLSHISGLQVPNPIPQPSIPSTSGLKKISDIRKLYTSSLSITEESPNQTPESSNSSYPSAPSSKINMSSKKAKIIPKATNKKIRRAPSKDKRKAGRPKNAKNAKGQKEYITEITQGKTKSYYCEKCKTSFSSERYSLNTHKCVGPETLEGATDPAIPDPGPVSPEKPIVPNFQVQETPSKIQDEGIKILPGNSPDESLPKSLDPVPQDPNPTDAEAELDSSDSTSRDSTTSTDCNAVDGEDLTVRLELLEEMEDLETQVCGSIESSGGSPATVLFELFECPMCRQSLEDQNSLNIHYLQEHCSQGPYTCFMCSEVFEGKDTLRDHLLEKHSETLVLSGDEVMQEVAYNVEC